MILAFLAGLVAGGILFRPRAELARARAQRKAIAGLVAGNVRSN